MSQRFETVFLSVHRRYFAHNTGPMVQTFLENIAHCSTAYCSGHGKCVPHTSTTCECFAGYTGPQCAQHV
eukprot:m.150149 g.150149  ORF g.150149 m.150149 type:complete len:70 (-) comp20658_c0_seq4:34-243(-)